MSGEKSRRGGERDDDRRAFHGARTSVPPMLETISLSHNMKSARGEHLSRGLSLSLTCARARELDARRLFIVDSLNGVFK